jgi:2-polyprenyl-3-methyl-5-hydroxy-6-metoxy-1,4-benzoquinol methylase
MHEIINKSMDSEDLLTDEAKGIIDELNDLIVDLRSRGLNVSSWYGAFDLSGDPASGERINRGYGYKALEGTADDRKFPWFLYWEIAWVIINGGFKAGQKVLDLGGSSSLFSYYLANKGLDVVTVDLQEDLVKNANFVAREMGWKLENHVMDMKALNFDDKFNHITSICVYEHIPMYDRVDINRRVRELLLDGGRFSITFDYRNPSRAARINSPEEIHEQFVKPSDLKIRGNRDFYDNGKNYLLHPFYYRKRLWNVKRICIQMGYFSPWEFFKTKDVNDYTFGALFLEK